MNKVGFYKTNVWPYYFMLVSYPHNTELVLWGFSIYNKKPDYRTYGDLYSKWKKEYGLKAQISKDYDRTSDIKFIKEYKRNTT